ncbi:hypothetical protein EVAR_67285_1 [Eumeta japonica]|uniref:Uncharacterized protein n=1 Tax=Eumeta variegata TaxID=151549 RepID=A0A4C1ZSD3_EUMVA|nr:hypothetical protein EVAR_67285_1 [Eumeta japonica]
MGFRPAVARLGPWRSATFDPGEAMGGYESGVDVFDRGSPVRHDLQRRTPTKDFCAAREANEIAGKIKALERRRRGYLMLFNEPQSSNLMQQNRIIPTTLALILQIPLAQHLELQQRWGYLNGKIETSSGHFE